MTKRVVIFASGGGSNFENLVRNSNDIGMEVIGLIVDKPNAFAINRAEQLKIPYSIFDRKEYKSRQDFESDILENLSEMDVDYLILAGFMRILSTEFVDKYDRKIINIHPSLLPAFRGATAIYDAYMYGVKVSGVTIHYVDSGVDTGEIIAQKSLYIEDGESLDSFEEKIHQLEYDLYPATLKKLFKGDVRE